MRTILFIFSFLISLKVFCQQDFNKHKTDSIVKKIENKSKKSIYFKWLGGSIEYKILDSTTSQIVYFYKAGPKEIKEIYYLYNSNIILAIRQARSYFFYRDATLTLRKFYFEEEILKEHKLNSSILEECSIQDAEQLIGNFKKAKSAIAWYQKKEKRRLTKGLAKV